MVRDYKPGDLASVISVFHRSVREVASRDYSSIQIAAWAPEPVDWDAWSSRLGSAGVFVYECGDEIIGFARVDDNGYIDLLYVHPAFQRQGIARRLLKRVLSWALNQGIRILSSEVSITARPFFQRMGFHIVKTQEVECRGIHFRNFLMELNIDPQRDR